jgi:cell division protein FtsQ
MQPVNTAASQGHPADDPQMARLDPRASRLKYRLERLMLTPLFRFSLRVVLPFAVCFGIGASWFAVAENREAFTLMLSEVKATVEDRPEFRVQVMAIDGAGPGVAQAIRRELSIDFPKSSFDLDLDAMQRIVTALDPVKKAEIRIRQGGVLQVDVTERVPAVLWRNEAGLQLLDRDGVFVAEARGRAEHADLAVIAGDILSPNDLKSMALVRMAQAQGAAAVRDLTPEELQRAKQAQVQMKSAVREALQLYALSGPIRARLRGFERMGARRWDVVLDRDQRIMLPETGAEQALEWATAMAVTPTVDLLSRDLVAVDLRLPRRPTIRMTEEATKEMWRIKAIEAGREVLR